MAKRGENIYKRKDMRWEGRYIKGHDISGKVIFGYVYASSYTEVKEKLIVAKASYKIDQAPTKIFGVYCDEWLDICKNRIKQSTYVKYHNIINKHIKPYFQNYDLHFIDTVSISYFTDKLLDENISPKSARDILSVLNSILKYLNRQSSSSFILPEIVYPANHPKDIRVLSVEEQTKLVAFLLCDMDNIKFGILLTLLTGMRIGEICALKWADISVDDGTITVSRSMQRLQCFNDEISKTKVVVSSTKSRSSQRIIPLTAYTVSLCKQMQCKDNDSYVLTGKQNKYMEPRALQYHLSKITKECSLEGVHFHTLRHTFATRCVEVDFEIKSLSEILGHSNVKITLDRYVHSSLELKRQNMDKLSTFGL